MVDVEELGKMYNKLLTAAIDKYEDIYQQQKIDAEGYAALLAQTSVEAMKIASSLVLQQELTEAEIKLKEKELLIKDKMLEKLEEEIDLLQTQDSELQANGLADRALKADKLLTEAKNRESADAQISLYNRQEEGFDDNKNQKLFEAQLNAWSLMFSSGLLTDKPNIVNNDEVSTLYNVMKP
jgi:hypothetical protein